ncbi:MAG TPA: SH3 domain-containing protein, partial [Burkholderiales bacterium]|nr:SH3 domain-containing protein [Burkholderiales bacterium]
MASRAGLPPAVVLLLAVAGWVFCAAPAAGAQAAKPAKPTKPAQPAAPPLEAGRYLVQIVAPEVNLHDGPRATEPVVARAEEGTRFEADARVGDWYRVRRANGTQAWLLDAPLADGRTIAVSAWPAGLRI